MHPALAKSRSVGLDSSSLFPVQGTEAAPIRYMVCVVWPTNGLHSVYVCVSVHKFVPRTHIWPHTFAYTIDPRKFLRWPSMQSYRARHVRWASKWRGLSRYKITEVI